MPRTKTDAASVERGVYRQPNGNYAVCARCASRLHFRTCGRDLEAARRAREELVAALASGKVPASRRLRFDTVADWWLARFEAKVAAGERHRARLRPTATTSSTTCCRAVARDGSPRSESTT